MSDVTLISGDARKIPLADESVQCIVTSPPYWGLRKYAGEQELIWPGWGHLRDEGLRCDEYGHEWTEERRGGTHGTCAKCGAWRGAYGLEPTVEMYVAHSLEILRELRRVLRKDGVLFWNLGDSYQSGDRGTYLRSRVVGDKSLCYGVHQEPLCAPNRFPQDGLKPKDLVLMPARIALAAQADGWWVRSVIIWAKPNPMPESVTDRPTDSYEHILMLTKSARYFWDADAVREKAETGWNGSSFTDERDQEVYANLGRGPRNAFGYTPKGTHSRGNGDGGPKARERAEEGTFEGWADGTREVLGSRNMRNVWMFPTQPYAGAHFATFPEELPRRCILAATSARGCCAQCGAPWERITKSESLTPRDYDGKWSEEEANSSGRRMLANLRASREAGYGDTFPESRTIGWSPTCLCRGQRGKTNPCVVLDPFGGSGTTGRVAIELGRRAVLLDLAYGRETAEDRSKGRSYAALAKERTSEVQTTFPLL